MSVSGLIGQLSGTQRVQFIQKSTNTFLTIDCTVQETHSRESPPSEYPVENGQSISDNQVIKPFALELHGIISDTPIDNLGTLAKEGLTTGISAVLPPIGIIAASAGYGLFTAIKGTKKPSVTAYKQLLTIQESKQPFDVVTSLNTYPGMWIKSISVPRDANTGQVLVFTLQLVQLILVSPQTVNIQVFKSPGLASSQVDAATQQMQSRAATATQTGVFNGLSSVGVTPP